MKSNPGNGQKSIGSPGRIQFIRKSIVIYVIFAAALPIFCIILGWRTVDPIGTGYLYGALCLVLFGILTLFGNTVPDQLSRLSLPKYSPPSTAPHKEIQIEESAQNNGGKKLFFTTLICGALLFVTGLILRSF